MWWALQDLNLGPMDYESTALTAELRARGANLAQTSLGPWAVKGLLDFSLYLFAAPSLGSSLLAEDVGCALVGLAVDIMKWRADHGERSADRYRIAEQVIGYAV